MSETKDGLPIVSFDSQEAWASWLEENHRLANGLDTTSQHLLPRGFLCNFRQRRDRGLPLSPTQKQSKPRSATAG